MSVVVLVGLFSTHLTYLILVAVYIFGYGVYTFNCQKNTCEDCDIQVVKEIIYGISETTKPFKIDKDSYYWDSYKYNCDVLTVESAERDKKNFNLPIEICEKRHFCFNLYKNQFTSKFFSRPPPLYA